MVRFRVLLMVEDDSCDEVGLPALGDEARDEIHDGFSVASDGIAGMLSVASKLERSAATFRLDGFDGSSCGSMRLPNKVELASYWLSCPVDVSGDHAPAVSEGASG